MSKTEYQGWELKHFDNSSNFRKYQNYLLNKHIKGLTAEIGPGNGELLNYYKDKLNNIDLFEPSKTLFDNLKFKFQNQKGISFKNEVFPLSEYTYDTILYLDVLEHIEDDKGEIIKAFNSLKTGGKLIVNVPAFQHLYSKFDKDVNHFRRYDKKNFFKLLKNLDYANYQMTYYDSVGYLLSLLSKIFSGDYKKNFNNKIKIWNALIPLSKIIDKLIFNLFGKSLFVIIQRK